MSLNTWPRASPSSTAMFAPWPVSNRRRSEKGFDPKTKCQLTRRGSVRSVTDQQHAAQVPRRVRNDIPDSPHVASGVHTKDKFAIAQKKFVENSTYLNKLRMHGWNSLKSSTIRDASRLLSIDDLDASKSAIHGVSEEKPTT